MEAALRSRIEGACREGRTSIHATGSSPGFINEAVPLVLLSLQRRLDVLTIDEFADLSSRTCSALLFNIMGFGAKISSFDEGRLQYLKHAVGPSLRLIADAIGMPLDGVEAKGEIGLARDDAPIAAGIVRRGRSRRLGSSSRAYGAGGLFSPNASIGSAAQTSIRNGPSVSPAGASSSRATRHWRSVSGSRCGRSVTRKPRLD